MNGLSGDDRAVIRSQKHADGCDFDWLSWAAQWSAVESLYIVLAKEGGGQSQHLVLMSVTVEKNIPECGWN